MKKELKVVAIVLVALIVFLGGFGIGASKGIKISVNVKNDGAQAAAASVTPAAAPTAAPTPATDPAPATTPAPAGNDATTAAPAPAGNDATTAAPSGGDSNGLPSSKEDIVAKYCEVINAAKKEQNVKIHKVSTVTLNCTDCSVGFLKGIVNTALKALATSTDDSFTINGGTGVKDSDGSEAHPNGIITPWDRDVTLKAEGVKEATCTAEGDGYKMVIVLNEEKSTYDGTNTVKPVHHESCLVPLNLATLELPIEAAKITQADMTYPGATLTVVVNGAGKVTSYDIKLPMSGTGTGAIKSVSLSVGIEGSMDELYEFTY